MSNNDHKAFLVFTAGPVQGFVGQARRTRDLWAGSWLLSYLSESALIAAERLNGTAIVPYRGQPGVFTSEKSKIGGIPNRFEVGFADPEPAAEAGRAAAQGFRQAWLDLCQQVWDRYLETCASKHGNGTREIWDRQIQNFWELSWVVAEDKSKAGHLAAGRKAYRNSPYTVEYGYKCSLMGTHQELSGHLKRGKGRDFWDAVRTEGRISSLDISPAEQLCAVSFVKRLYPKVHKALKDADAVSWPSTSFIAALPWLKNLDTDHKESVKRYVDLARNLKKIEQSERSSAKEYGVELAYLDAQIWYQGGLERNEWGLDKGDLKTLTENFRKLKDQRDKKPLPVWALLVMDGDSLGALLSKLKNATVLSQCLEKFSKLVAETVKNHNGKTVYAGGDDVLAMLPAETAVEAAAELSQKYHDCFSKTEAKGEATISGAIIFAPLHYPFQRLVKQGHELLDKVAKDQTGRDALAIDIVLGSGLSARWSAPWSVVRGEEKAPGLLQVLPRFRRAEERDESGDPAYNASFLYNLREQFLRLFPDLSGRPGEFGMHRLDSDELDVLSDIANAEYRRRLGKKHRASRTAAETLKDIEQLMWLSRRYYRDSERRSCCDKGSFSFDGWRVARFLQQVKEGDLGEH